MGGCAGAFDTGDNSAPDMRKYVDVKIDETFEHPGHCEYCQQGGTNCGSNGEFIYGGNSGTPCKCRALCHDGCCKKLCKRISYSGDISRCCTSGGPDFYIDGTGVRTCPPNTRAKNFGTSTTCNIPMKIFCSQSNNLFKPACLQWAKAVARSSAPNDADEVIKTVCMRAENYDKPECACVKAAYELQQKGIDGKQVPAHCIENSCVNEVNALRTSSQLIPCNVVNCQMKIEDIKFILQNKGQFDVKFVQECGNELRKQGLDPDKIDDATVNPTPKPTPKPTPLNPSFFETNRTYIIIGVVVLIILIIIFVYLSTRSSDNDSSFNEEFDYLDTNFNNDN